MVSTNRNPRPGEYYEHAGRRYEVWSKGPGIIRDQWGHETGPRTYWLVTIDPREDEPTTYLAHIHKGVWLNAPEVAA